MNTPDTDTKTIQTSICVILDHKWDMVKFIIGKIFTEMTGQVENTF